MGVFSSRLIAIALILIGFSATLVWLDIRADYKTNERYSQISNEFIYSLKKNQISEIVAAVHSTAKTSLKNTYKSHQNKLKEKAENFYMLLNGVKKERWCPLMDSIVTNGASFYYQIQKNGKPLCESDGYPQEIELKKPLYNDVVSSFKIDNEYSITLLYLKEQIYISAQDKIASLIRELHFQDPNIYVWVNEVRDYKGGDGYAIRRVHPNLPHTEGMYLSTNTKDIKGNLPYLEELDGIKQRGEVYLEYYFKKKTNDLIRHKLSYAKIFKPFDWIIATGIYLDDIENIVELEKEKINKEHSRHIIAEIIVASFLTGIVIFLLYKKEEKDIHVKEAQLKDSHNLQRVKDYQQVLYSMLDMVEKRDTYTAGHTQRVARYSVLIAEAMHLAQDKIAILFEAAIMHDIGKVSTPDNILLKPNKLSDDEYKIIQEHLNCGYEILSSIEAFQEHAEIMRNHHERYDGKGYPRGLKGEQIPLLSQILIVVDAFDAMTSKRIYKQSKSLEEALKELEDLKGKQFSPSVVDVAIPVLKKNGVIPAEDDYLGNSIEEARVAHYYKDFMTGLYNYHYLEHILFFAKHMQKKSFHCCYFIDIRHFHQYNSKHGWLEGNTKLKEIAQCLKKNYPNALKFRIYGDDFLLLFEEHEEIDKEKILSIIDLKDTGLDVSLHHIRLDNIKAKDFMEFSEYIMSFARSLKEKRK